MIAFSRSQDYALRSSLDTLKPCPVMPRWEILHDFGGIELGKSSKKCHEKNWPCDWLLTRYIPIRCENVWKKSRMKPPTKHGSTNDKDVGFKFRGSLDSLMMSKWQNAQLNRCVCKPKESIPSWYNYMEWNLRTSPGMTWSTCLVHIKQLPGNMLHVLLLGWNHIFGTIDCEGA